MSENENSSSGGVAVFEVIDWETEWWLERADYDENSTGDEDA